MKNLFVWLGASALVAALVFGGSWSSDRAVAQDKGGMTFEVYKDAKDEFRRVFVHHATDPNAHRL